MKESENLYAADRVYQSALSDFSCAIELMCEKHASRCESPIEVMLLTAIDCISLLYASDDTPAFVISPTNEPASGDGKPLPSIVVTPQYQWNDYRIDFRFDFICVPTPVFVECDGHDYHERTKEQAERDRSRDRKIQDAGIPILRFTGREIHRNPIRCAVQILVFMRNRAVQAAGVDGI